MAILYQHGLFMTIFWILLVLLAAVSNIADIVMKLGVKAKLPSEEQFSWWSRSYWKVERKYGEIYPDSYLPPIARVSFWLFVAMFVMWAIASTTGRLD
jgi:hypothetical protein